MYTLILVDYNSLDATISYIERCTKALGKAGTSHIVIVENGANENTVECLQQSYGPCEILHFEGIEQTLYLFSTGDRQIIYCHSGGNLGYAKGNNLGAQIAQIQWADPYYIVSNNDIDFHNSLDLQLAQTLFEAHSEIGIIGPQVTTPAGVSQSPRKWIGAFRRLIVYVWLCSVINILPARCYSWLKTHCCEDLCVDAQTGPCGWVSGCFMIVRAAAFHEAGMFDPNTFLYGEEPILGRRMERAGYSVWFCKEIAVIHNHAQTTKNALSRLKIMELNFQTMCYYYQAYTPNAKIVVGLAKCNFALFKCFHLLWNKLKGLLKKKHAG